ncbi:TPA: hypothetical protein OUZ74_002110 [Legionella pneumophila]|nr:hypothetical protein [Legionella pneumophila]HCJ1111003.1 hypothetical protein [Legionella pneumophila]HCU6013170.1 hypothetical protein [Legionella pneumophila]
MTRWRPLIQSGNFVGSIQYMNVSDIDECIGHDCIAYKDFSGNPNNLAPMEIYKTRLTKK